MFLIRQHNSLVPVAAVIIFVVSVLRIPVAEGYFRPLFQLIMETGILFLCALWVCSVNKWVGCFLILTLFSSIYPNFGKWSYMARNTIFIGALWYVMIVSPGAGIISRMMAAICVIAILNVVFANFQYCGLDPYRTFTLGTMKSVASHPTGLMANKNLLSALLAFSLPCFFRTYWKWFVPFIFYGLTIASSLGGAIAVFIGCISYFFLKDGGAGLTKNFFNLLFLIVWFLFFMIKVDSPVQTEMQAEGDKTVMAESAALRLDAWKKGMTLYAANHPMFGYGIGHWKLAFKKITPPGEPVMTKAHNEYLQAWFEMGVLFPVLLGGYFFDVLRRYRKEAIIPMTSFIIIILNSGVNFPFHVATTAIIALTMMAVLELRLKPNN